MRAGLLDRSVTLRQMIATQDAYGEPIETWSDQDTIWAQRVELTGSERFVSEQTVAKVDAKYRIRFRSGVTVQHRLLDAGREYDIHAVIPIGRNEGLELLVSARGE